MPEWFENDTFWCEMYPHMFSETRLSMAEDEVNKILALTSFQNGGVLDLCCGPGRHSVAFAKRGYRVTGVDRTPFLLKKARENARMNDIDIDIINEDLASHLTSSRYSYIDVDPFGSPVPFLDQAVRSVLSGGILAVTATDTAALTGSIPRVARRRYGITLVKTPHMHEISCRALSWPIP